MMYQSKVKKQHLKYKRGQTVRITTFLNKFQRGFEIQNTNEIFVIHSININLPLPMYKLHLLGNSQKIIKGSFYEHELIATELEKLYIEKKLRNNEEWTLIKLSGHSVPAWEPRIYRQDILKKKKLLKVKNIVKN